MIYLGLDLGQAADYTALCITETFQHYQDAKADWSPRIERVPLGEQEFHTDHLERFPLGTSYPDIVAHMGRLVKTFPARTLYKLVVDETGVGRPVVELLIAAGPDVVPITITGGTEVVQDGIGYHVPKRMLVSTLQVLLQSRRLKFADGMAELPHLIQEVLAFKVKITLKANDTYGAWREGTHDDLILAVAMATWYAENIGDNTVQWGLNPMKHYRG